jgi:ABC-type bacteriocin/lantibiotic exporter with double-glycine peptidase domain
MQDKPDFREQYAKGLAAAGMHAGSINMIVDAMFISLGITLIWLGNMFLIKLLGAAIAGIWGLSLFRSIKAKRRKQLDEQDATEPTQPV